MTLRLLPSFVQSLGLSWGQSLAQSLGQPLVQRRLASPLAIWGKLPSHADFVQHRATAAQAHDRQDWVAGHWPRAAMPQAEPLWVRRAPSQGTGRLPAEPLRRVPSLSAVPVAFVIQSGVLPFSRRHCVQGVTLASSDQIGRPCPLVVYQQISGPWLLRTWGGQGVPSPHGLLFWLARITARIQAGNISWNALRQAVDGLGQLYAPGARHLLGAAPPAPPTSQLQRLLGSYCASEEADVAWALRGRQSRPFSHWPAHSLHAQQPGHSFWQQDLQGAFITTGQHLSTLWGVRT